MWNANTLTSIRHEKKAARAALKRQGARRPFRLSQPAMAAK
jgi:hypothetical protein